jgi:protein involved in polysaccharide export with SLBB domain
MFRRLLVCALLFLPGLSSAHAQTDQIVRPRRTQPAPDATESKDRPAQSPDAGAEAKRLYKIGVKYGHAGLYAQAAQTFEQALKLKPDYADAYLSLGHAYYDLHQWERAVDSLQRGLALKPGDKTSQNRLAYAQKLLEQRTAQAKRQAVDTRNEPAIGATISLGGSAPTKAPANDALTKIYRVGPGDVLDVRLTEGTPSQSTLFTISAAGLLEHPDLSTPLQSAGLTVEEITTRIEEDLKRREAIKNPKVSVAVEEYISHTILVSGLVKEPGTKSMKREGIPLYVVVADAQPLPEAGRVSVQRNQSNESFIVDLLDTAAMNLLIRTGDVVTLLENEAQFFYVSGPVKSPGEKPFRRGLTLTQAIIAAGGLSKSSKMAQLARDKGKGFLVVTHYKLKDIESGKVPDPVLQPGDRITIID